MSIGINKTIIKDFGFYGFFLALPQLLLIVQSKFVTKLMSEKTFFELGNLLFYRTIFLAIVLFGLESALARKWYELTDKERPKLISTIIIFIFIFGVCLCGIIYFTFPLINNIFSITEAIANKKAIIVYTLLSVIFLALNTIIKIVCRFNESRIAYATISIINGICICVFIYLFLSKSGNHLQKYSLALFFSEFITFCVGLLFINKNFIFVVDKLLLKEALNYGFFLLFLALVISMYNGLDRQFLGSKIAATELGNYYFNSRMAQFIVFFTTAAQGVISFFVIKYWNESEGKKSIIKLQILYTYAAFIVTFVLIAFSKYYFVLFNGKNYSLTHLFPIFIIINLVLSMQAFAFIGSAYKKKTHINLAYYLLGLLVFVIVAKLPLSIHYDMQIVIALLIGAITCTALGYAHSKKVFDKNIFTTKQILYFGWGILLCILLNEIILKFEFTFFCTTLLFLCVCVLFSLIFIKELKKIFINDSTAS